MNHNNAAQEDALKLIKNLGYYQTFYTAASQFNSIIFRLVVGVLSGINSTALAIDGLAEYTVNASLEIPGGWLSDRIGKARCGLLGLTGLAISQIFVFLAVYLAKSNPSLSGIFIILDGIVLGSSGPLLSGSVEGFYQAHLQKIASSDENLKALVEDSFTHSANFGKYVTPIATLGAFVLSYIYSANAKYLLLAGMLLYIFAIVRLLKDYIRFGDPFKSEHPPHTAVLLILKNVCSSKKLKTSFFLRTSYFALAAPIAGFGIVSLGRYYQYDQTLFWKVLFLFYFGNLFVGWYLRGLIVPKLLARYTRNTILSALFICYCALSFYLANHFDAISINTFLVVLVIYLMFYQLLTGSINSFATNLALNETDPSLHALALSIQNIPGYIFTVIFCGGLIKWFNGAFNPHQMFLFLAYASILTLAPLLFMKMRGIEY